MPIFHGLKKKTGHGSRSGILVILLLAGIMIFSSGCSLFKGDRETGEKKENDSVFASEREKQSDLAEYTASAGRADPKKKKKVHPGQMFLLSDKAKEIYANTERE